MSAGHSYRFATNCHDPNLNPYNFVEESTEPEPTPFDSMCAPRKKGVDKFKPGNFLDSTAMPYPYKRRGKSPMKRKTTVVAGQGSPARSPTKSPTKFEIQETTKLSKEVAGVGVGSPLLNSPPGEQGRWSPREEEAIRAGMGSDMMKMSDLSEQAKREARTERGRQSPSRFESQLGHAVVDWGERSVASGSSVKRFLARALKKKEEFEQQPTAPPEQFPATVNETQERFYKECDIDQEKAYEVFRKKLREFPEACFPRKEKVEVVGGDKKAGSPEPVAKIDKEMMIENGKELYFKKPNADKLRDPFFNKPRFGESDSLAPIRKLKSKNTNIDAQLRKLTKDELKKIPGQDNAFPGKPILQGYYHQIIPTKS